MVPNQGVWVGGKVEKSDQIIADGLHIPPKG